MIRILEVVKQKKGVLAQALVIIFCSLGVSSSCTFKTRVTATNVQLSEYFGSNMVFQEGEPIVIKGKADPFGMVGVRIERATKVTEVDEQGNWTISFPAVDYNGKFEICVLAKDKTIELNNCIVGEVWAVLGDNWLADHYLNFETSITHGIQNTNVRCFQPEISRNPSSGFKGAWGIVSRKQIKKWELFSQMLGDALNEFKGRNIGIVNLSWPGMESSDFLATRGKTVNDSVKISYFEQQKKLDQAINNAFNGLDKGVVERRYDDSDWPEIDFPILISKKKYLQNKVLWLRKKVLISEKYLNGSFKVDFGAVRGNVISYFNGVEIARFKGETNNYAINIPDSLLKIWMNTLTVRMVTADSLSGFYSETPKVTNSDSSFRMNIAEDWKYRSYLEATLPKLSNVPKNRPDIKEKLFEPLNGIRVHGIIIAGGFDFYNSGKSENNLDKVLHEIKRYLKAKQRYMFIVEKPGMADEIVNGKLFNAARNSQLQAASENGFKVVNSLDLEPLTDTSLFYYGQIERLLRDM